MKITYTPNPLDTIVELDEHEKQILRLKLKLEKYEDMIFSAHFAISCRLEDRGSLKAYTVEEALDNARKELDPDFWCNDEEGKKDHSKLDSLVDELLEHYLEELRGTHVGDCTCVAVSCSKCHAERLLGINTLAPYPGKHVLFNIAQAFSRWNEETKQHDGPEVSLDEAIQKLANFDPQPPKDTTVWDKMGGFFQFVPKWKAEAKAAHDWLIQYQDNHFPKE